MKNQLSNMLLAGVIASTFLMVNCQKAPSKAVKAADAKQKAAGDVAVIVACNEAASAALGQRSSDLAALKAEYNKVAPSVYGADGKPKADASIDAATAEGIRKLQETLTASQASVEQAISALKDAAGNAATGCSLKTKAMNPETKKEEEKQQDLALESLKSETNSLLSATSGLLKYEAGKASTDTTLPADDNKEDTATPVTNDDSMSEEAKKAQAEAEAKANAAKNVSDDSSKASEDGSKASDDGSKASDDGSKASDDGSNASDDPTPAEQL